MQRKKFICGLFGTAAFFALDSLPILMGYNPNKPSPSTPMQQDYITFGAIHLNIIQLQRSIDFYTKITGFKLRSRENNIACLGTADETLLVLHESATQPCKQGFSGLYHVAFHAPDKHEFAHMLYRVQQNAYPHAPIDHTMSQSVYLDDPDGITIELVLETPERYNRIATERGSLEILGTDGVYRGASDRLDVNAVLSNLQDKNTDREVLSGTKVGHIHLYVNHLENNNIFYKSLGLEQFNLMANFGYADLSAGGHYKHRVAINTWHSKNKPLAPSTCAGMRYYQLIFHQKSMLDNALLHISSYEKQVDGFMVKDAAGNCILLSYA